MKITKAKPVGVKLKMSQEVTPLIIDFQARN
jgi:hypothetical protein